MKINGVEVFDCDKFDKYVTYKCEGKHLCSVYPECEYKKNYKKKEEQYKKSLKYLCTEFSAPQELQDKYKEEKGKVEYFFRLITKARNKTEAQNKVKEVLGIDVSFENSFKIWNKFEKDLCDLDKNNIILVPCNLRNNQSYLMSENL